MNLRECPFCGAAGEIEEFQETINYDLGSGTNISLPWSKTKTWYRPKCSLCDCKLDNGWKTPHGAVKDWNDRRAKVNEWLKKASQMAQQQVDGGDNVPLSSAWGWLIDNIREAEGDE